MKKHLTIVIKLGKQLDIVISDNDVEMNSIY